jgi:hypothetical protein
LVAPVVEYLEAARAVRAGALVAIPSGVEGAFIRVAADYSRLHEISARAWLVVGVSALVVEAAGIVM